MPSHSMVRFMSSLAEDPALASGLYETVGDLKGDAALNAVAAFAGRNGFEVAIDDVANLRTECLAVLQGDRDLSDDELEAIDGGILLQVVDRVKDAMSFVASGLANPQDGTLVNAVQGVGNSVTNALDGAAIAVGDWMRQW